MALQGEKTGPSIMKDLARAPGVGKGTQCTHLAEDLPVLHLSVGDLMRAECAREASKLKPLIEQHMRDGTLVPDDMSIEILKDKLVDGLGNGWGVFLIDGFPRNLAQARLFEGTIRKATVIFNFQCSPGTLLKRVLRRGATSGRIDDTEEIFWKRYHAGQSDEQELIRHFRSEQRLIHVDCESPLDDIYPHLKRTVEEVMLHGPNPNVMATDLAVDCVDTNPGEIGHFE
ncbi:hypothetical protein MMC09_006295 [Bachmanniomyces sp. S44760]|nr:hypothetical protein [Bachmanniomyces sp. S44760]